MGQIEFKKPPPIGEDIDKHLYPTSLPNNPQLLPENFWNERIQTWDRINHRLYRRVINIYAGLTPVCLVGGIAGWIISGRWQVGVGTFVLGALTGKIGTDVAVTYNQKLKDAGHPFIKTREII